MIRAERLEQILAVVSRKGAVGIQELTAALGASPATVRRDLEELHARNLVLRSHGGASLPARPDERAYSAKVTTFLGEKRRIGAAAASLIGAGQTIGCGGGTTVMSMIRALRRTSLRVVTTAINVAAELADNPHVDVTVTGGRLRGRSLELVGHVAERTLHDINLDLAIIGVDGLSLAHGATTHDEAEAYVNRVLVGRARETWSLADHSKFDQVRPASIVPLSQVAKVFTDAEAPPSAIKVMREAGIDIVVS